MQAHWDGMLVVFSSSGTASNFFNFFSAIHDKLFSFCRQLLKRTRMVASIALVQSVPQIQLVRIVCQPFSPLELGAVSQHCKGRGATRSRRILLALIERNRQICTKFLAAVRFSVSPLDPVMRF